ncbi:hypothetical protein DP113_23695 [Brasilonema octagenarum UFV-E1]|uniref:Uncharacterized protein n=2 Tax=Brasilonema TaxID=383614 RepID=A0A856MK45_9CYAN|nr:hypothetical protein [Brasilonema octagenarum UFV-OR1]QDL10514.1 hypothetical protein DP114_23790 [Brasilonema sennae CENA114]QDL16860.1 hypothetical protein DP113_23695 [Brasilonema octagenarum UFV-E1]
MRREGGFPTPSLRHSAPRRGKAADDMARSTANAGGSIPPADFGALATHPYPRTRCGINWAVLLNFNEKFWNPKALSVML